MLKILELMGLEKGRSKETLKQLKNLEHLIEAKFAPKQLTYSPAYKVDDKFKDKP